MTVLLTHRLLDSEGEPVVGRIATVALYDAVTAARSPGTYQRSRATSAVSGDDGRLSWELPETARWARQETASYVVTGIEDQRVLLTVPQGVSTVTVAATRTGTVLPVPGAAAPLDLVTEAELSRRLASFTPDLGAELAAELAAKADEATVTAGLAARAPADPVLSNFSYDGATGNLLSYQEDGITITLTYNADGTVATSKRGSAAVKTYSYSGGNLSGVA